jgi:membrane-bound metal-dependent hydrolase YbcI (DUF457 family)
MEPLVHVLIPLLFLMAIFPKLDKKYVFWLLPLTFLMDFDLFLPGHRWMFHNLLFLFVVAFIVWFVWDKRAWFVSLFYLGSHLILDLGDPGVAFFYPFFERTFYLASELQMTPEGFVLDFGFRVREFSELVFGYANWVSITGSVFVLLALVLVVVRYWEDIKKKCSG